MSAQHSPLPWKCTRECIIDNANAPVAECDALALSQRLDEANAAYIVRSVNAHDELVAALEALADRVAAQHLNVPLESGFHALLVSARAALAKAKVQP